METQKLRRHNRMMIHTHRTKMNVINIMRRMWVKDIGQCEGGYKVEI
jgi:hypothetical protein